MILLRKLRVDALLSVEQLADQTGVPARTIYRAENGDGIRLASRGKLAEYFDVAPSALQAEVSELPAASAAESEAVA